MKKINNLKKRLGLISASVLMLLGGTAVSNHVHADTGNNNIAPKVIKIQPEVPDGSGLRNSGKSERQAVINQRNYPTQSREVIQQTNKLRNRIVQQMLDQNKKRQNSSINQVQQKRAEALPHSKSSNVIIISQEPHKNIPNNAPAPVKYEHGANSKIIDPKLKKETQGLLDDLKVVANNPVDVQDLNLNNEIDHRHLTFNQNNNSGNGH